MPPLSIKTEEKVTLIGAGPFQDHLFATALARASVLYAADGGADFAASAGQFPLAIIGDLDSLTNTEYWQNSDTELLHVPDQDTTDFEKCLELIHAPLILGIGFLGGRLDHQLAALSALLRFHEKSVILISENDICFLCPAHLEIRLPVGTCFSVYPLQEVTGTHSDGLFWPVENLTLRAGGLVGTSNITTGADVRVGFDRPGALISLPLEWLDAAIAALSKTEH